MKKRIYLDYNATTPVLPSVQKQVQDALQQFGNPSSLYQEGQWAKAAIENARQQISQYLHVHPERLVFTSSGSESIATVFFKTCTTALLKSQSTHVITSSIEHSAGIENCRYLEGCGARVSYLPVSSDGLIDPKDIELAIQEDTKLISIIMANNEIGTIQNMPEIVKIAKAHQIPIHTDAVQAIGKMKINIDDLGVDYLSFSGHKLYAPKGIAGLIVPQSEKPNPLIRGGGQERRERSGTENVAGILAMKAAFDWIYSDLDSHLAHLQDLKKCCLTELGKYPLRYCINGNQEHCLPNTLNLSFDKIPGEAIMMNLDLAGIAVSTGSACSTGAITASHVLLALGQTEETALNTLRVSWGIHTNQDEIKTFVKTLYQIIERLDH